MKFSTKFKPIGRIALLLTGALVLSAANAVPVTWNGWTFDYEIGVNKEGLALKNIKFQGRAMLKKVSLPVVNVDRSGGTSNEQCVLATDTFNNILTPMPWANNATLSQRQITRYNRLWFEIGIYKKIGSREYFQAYYLSKDGILDAHLYTRGGWSCPSELRNPFWRVDVDIDGANNDILESTTANNPFTASSTEGYNPDQSILHRWRVRDSVTNAYVMPDHGFGFNHPDGNLTQSTWPKLGIVWGALYKASEDIGFSSFSQYQAVFNNENIYNQDLVLSLPGNPQKRNTLGASDWVSHGISLLSSMSQSTLSDVVVDDLTYNFGNYETVVRNLGATTPAGKVIAVGIYVDGIYKTWSASGESLKPGETRFIYNTPINRFFIPSGLHTVKAWVDDLNRFPEIDENNNQHSEQVTVTGPLVKITSPTANATVSGASVLISARASDPSGIRGGVIFSVDNQYIGTKVNPPYSITWNSTATPEGPHLLTALAENNLGQVLQDGVLVKVAAGSANQPDITVTDLSYTSGLFSATIKNIGTGEVPAGTWMGFGYFVDGLEKTWTYTTDPIAPGESRTLGVAGGGPYTIPSGQHTIKVVADDQSSVAESNETNNQLTKVITVP